MPSGARAAWLLWLTRGAQAAWLGLALFLAAAFAVGTVMRYQGMLQLCDGPVAYCMQVSQLRPVNVQGFEPPDAVLQFYAVFYTVEQVAVRLFLWAFALLLFARGRRDPVALLASFWLLTFAPAFAELVAAQQWPWLMLPLTAARVVSRVSLTLFLFLFPNGRFVPRWTRWPAAALAAYHAAAIVVVGDAADIATANIDGLLLVAEYALALGAQIYRYRRAATITERQQTKWVLFGIGMAALFLLGTRLWIIADWNPDAPISAAYYGQIIGFVLFTISIPAAIGLSILRYRLFDIDIFINRALVYGVLTAGVVGIYAAVVGGLGSLFQPQNNLPLSLLATGSIALVFQPARDRVQRGVNRLMFGERDEPYRVLTRLGQRFETALAPSAALSLAVETVATALKLPYAAVALKHDGALVLAAAHGEPRTPLTCVPLVYAGEPIGELRAAARAPGEDLTTADRRLLGDLARPIGAVAHAALLAAELESARLRIVAAGEEVRRRLGSDLHDGVGHQLAGLTRQVQIAAEQVERDPAAARAQLRAIERQLNAAIGDVRSLAHQLHPPELELLGLAGALQERALNGGRTAIRFDASASLPRLPAAVQTAAYYIALEALANVEKHAEARVCTVRLRYSEAAGALQHPMLEMEITDDGRGVPSDAAHGLGLLSMQARAAEVGGVCRIEPGPGGGTRISARFPCPAE